MQTQGTNTDIRYNNIVKVYESEQNNYIWLFWCWEKYNFNRSGPKP